MPNHLRTFAPMKPDIRKASPEDIAAYVAAQGWEAYRARQIDEWLWARGAITFREMTNLSKAQRETLGGHWSFQPLTLDILQTSTDGTIKYRWRCHDGHLIESVLIPVPEDTRYTVCVSSQVGCSLTCSFCATGRMGRLRNLDAAEVFDQVLMVDRHCREVYGHQLTNIVYMGMGEPLLNYAQVLESIRRITDPAGFGMSPRRITVSTAGIAKAIRRLADDGVKFNLALSLHAADDTKRSEIMPINTQNDLASLMEALRYFYAKTGNRISYEYIALRRFNDSLADAKRLVTLCRQHFPVGVNIIEYNPVEGVPFSKSDEETVDRFARVLRDHGVMVTVRRSRGQDIDAACGQLANK